MLNEEFLELIITYKNNTGRNPDMLKLHPAYFRAILEELNYPEWIIKKKMTEMKKSVFGVPVKLTDTVENFELWKIYNGRNHFSVENMQVILELIYYIVIVRSGGKHNSINGS